jgi:hypothetical protein
VTESGPVEPRPGGAATAGGAAVPAADPWRRFDRWTSTFFIVLAVVTLLAAITVLPFAAADRSVSGSAGAVLVAATVFQIAVLGVASAGLDLRLPWGRTAAVGLLLVTIGADVVRVVVDLTRSQLTIPLAGVVALCLLTIRPGPLRTLDGRDRLIASGILVVAILAQVVAMAPALLAS